MYYSYSHNLNQTRLARTDGAVETGSCGTILLHGHLLFQPIKFCSFLLLLLLPSLTHCDIIFRHQNVKNKSCFGLLYRLRSWSKFTLITHETAPISMHASLTTTAPFSQKHSLRKTGRQTINLLKCFQTRRSKHITAAYCWHRSRSSYLSMNQKGYTQGRGMFTEDTVCFFSGHEIFSVST